MSAVLDVVRGPESLRCCIVAFVEKGVESLEDQCLVLLLELAGHLLFPPVHCNKSACSDSFHQCNVVCRSFEDVRWRHCVVSNSKLLLASHLPHQRLACSPRNIPPKTDGPCAVVRRRHQ